MASNGLTAGQIADCLGISESTLYAKQGENKEFMVAIKSCILALSCFAYTEINSLASISSSNA